MLAHIGGKEHSMTADFPPLDRVTNPLVKTDAAAHYLLRSQSTLHAWSRAAPEDNVPLRPVKIGARLAWSADKIRRLVGGAA
jgi:hypothetical protein